MWMPKMDWLPDVGYLDPKAVQMVFSESTTEEVADVFILWVGDDGGGRKLLTQHWKCPLSTGIWEPVPGPLRQTVVVAELSSSQSIGTVERSESGDFLIQLTSTGGGT